MTFTLQTDSISGEEYIGVHQTGKALLRDPLINKGSAFTAAEREALDLVGLLPVAVSSMEQQLDRTYEHFRAQPNDLARHVNLANLHDRNETLFFRLLQEHLEEMMPVVYTPVVGLACQHYSHIYRQGRGLHVSYDQRGRIEAVLRQVEHPPSVIVVTDGERILGLGDQGVGGMGIPIGKACLYTLCGGIPPHRTLPVMLDVGTDNEERLADPLYLGLRHERIRGEAYQAFIDEFVEGVTRVFPHALLQWEDLLKGNALTQLQRFRDRVCSFNDDIQGTAAVCVAGIHGGLRVSRQPARDQRIVLAGAGAAAQGIADLVVADLMEEGVSQEAARRRIWMVDRQGLVVDSRAGLEPFKMLYARSAAEIASYECADPTHIDLETTVANARPTVLIGISGQPGLFDRPVIERMAALNERPLIFPLSNPTSNSECHPRDALRWSDGRAVVSTGSPYPPVRHGATTIRVGQGNNAFIFPGVGLGVMLARVRRVSDGLFLAGARALAATVTDGELASGSIFPSVTRIRECAHAVACAVIRRAVADGEANEQLLEGLDGTVREAMWRPEYRAVRFIA